jgi:hypothetical protein
MVWSRKRLLVPPADRFRVVGACSRRSEGETVENLLRVLSGEFLEPLDQLLSLLANGYLVVDLNSGFGPGTRLRVGPAALAKELPRPRDRLLSLLESISDVVRAPT